VTTMNVIFLYDLAIDLLSVLGLVYLLVVEREFVGYRRLLYATTIGLLLFALAEPLSLWFPRWFTHGIHGVGLLCIALGMVKPVTRGLRDDDWATMLVKRPESLRPRPDWMKPMDDEILTLFHSADLVFSPTLIAYNLDHSREGVNRRLSTLEDRGFVERVERGRYRLSADGEDYFHGFVYATPDHGSSQAD